MTDYLIFIYDNSTDEPIVEAIPFAGEFNDAKEYAFSIATRTSLNNVGIMIWDKSDYHNDLDYLISIDMRCHLRIKQ